MYRHRAPLPWSSHLVIACLVGAIGLIAGSPATAAMLSWSRPIAIARLAVRAPALEAVWCPTVSFCVATDASGDVLATRDPSGGSRAWNQTQVEPDAPNAAGFIARGPDESLTGISCVSTSFCIGVDSGGDVLASRSPDGGSRRDWKRSLIPGASGFAGISCPTVDLCVAIGANGDIATSSDPDGGARAWTIARVDTAGIGCPESSQAPAYCQANLGAVSCARGPVCLAVDDAGDVLSSTDPTGGPAAWTITRIATGLLNLNISGELGDSVSCPSRGFCVVAEDTGTYRYIPSITDVYTSTDPTGPADDWQPMNLHDGSLDTVSCASSRFCVIGDAAGHALVSSTPAVGGSWRRQLIDPGMAFTDGIVAVSCPSAQLCVAGDLRGRAVIGRDVIGRPGRPAPAPLGVIGPSFAR